MVKNGGNRKNSCCAFHHIDIGAGVSCVILCSCISHSRCIFSKAFLRSESIAAVKCSAIESVRQETICVNLARRNAHSHVRKTMGESCVAHNRIENFLTTPCAIMASGLPFVGKPPRRIHVQAAVNFRRIADERRQLEGALPPRTEALNVTREPTHGNYFQDL